MKLLKKFGKDHDFDNTDHKLKAKQRSGPKQELSGETQYLNKPSVFRRPKTIPKSQEDFL